MGPAHVIPFLTQVSRADRRAERNHMKIEKISDIVAMAKELRPMEPAAIVAAHDDHVLEAVVRAYKDGFIKPYLIGREEAIRGLLREMGENDAEYTIVPAETEDECAQVAVELARKGEAHLLVKGLLETAQLMRCALKKDTGIRQGEVVSALGLFEFSKYHKLLALTDMGINTYPDVDRKEAIIRNAVDFMHKIDIPKPKVAVLAAAEKASEKMPDTMDALELKKRNAEGRLAGCIVEGPISFDLAIFPGAAAIKKYESPVAGDADVLLFPDITSGNIGTKAMGFFGEPKNADIVLGCSVPIVFGSRGGPAEGKYVSIGLSAIVASRS